MATGTKKRKGGKDLGNGKDQRIKELWATELVSERNGDHKGRRQSVDETLNVARDYLNEYDLQVDELRLAKIDDTQVMAYFTEGANTVTLSTRYADAEKMNQVMDDAYKEGFHPSRGNKTGTEATMAHEMGHALNEKIAVANNMSLDAMAKKIIREAVGKGNPKAFAGKISKYAQESNAECIAEAMTDVYCNGKNAKAESKKIEKIVRRYLK